LLNLFGCFSIMSHIQMTAQDIVDVAEFSGPGADRFTAMCSCVSDIRIPV